MTFKLIIFDLDNTLYPADNGLMQQVGHRIQVWLCDHLALTWEQAFARRREYLHHYGTTLAGLVAERGVDAHDYLTFVHDIPVEEYIRPNPALAAMLDRIPLRKAVYTNANSEYGQRVLRALGVADRFEQVVGIERVGLRNKSNRDAYEQALALLNAQGCECIMVEDWVRNLQPAKALGLTTVLVDADGLASRSSGSRPGSMQPPPVPMGIQLHTAPDQYVDFVVGDVLDVEQVVVRLLRREGR